MATCELLEIKQGATFSIQFTVYESGAAKDLTGYTILSQMRKSVRADDLIASFTVGTTQLANGIFTLGLSATETGLLPCGDTKDASESQFVWDCKMTSAGGVSTRLIDASPINVSAAVSR